MILVIIFLSFFLSLFSTAVLLYIAIATYIGPWIAPTIALISLLIMRLIAHNFSTTKAVAYITCASSVGGMVATAVGFSYPTLYFLDPVLFSQSLKSPFYFSGIITGLTLAAGLFGFWIADFWENDFLDNLQLPFPIGEMTCKVIVAHKSVRKAYELVGGFLSSFFFSLSQTGIKNCRGIIPAGVTLVSSHAFGPVVLPAIHILFSPFLWAIGFVTGKLIAQPLIIGACARFMIIDPLAALFFPSLGNDNFLFAFCGGMMVCGTASSFRHLPAMIYKGLKKYAHYFSSLSSHNVRMRDHFPRFISLTCICVGIIIFLSYLHFPLITQIYLLITSYACTYNIALITGKMGLATLGRFATFVMVPAMFLFNLTKFQFIYIATFVEIAGAVAADVLNGRKIGRECHLSRPHLRAAQIFGLVVSCAAVGILLWCFLQKFHLGSTDFFAGRAQSRALLMSVSSFDYAALILGVIFSYLLQLLKANPLLVLGGILMPLNFSIGLLLGAAGTFLVKDPDEWVPFWSGVFAASSLWMLMRLFF